MALFFQNGTLASTVSDMWVNAMNGGDDVLYLECGDISVPVHRCVVDVRFPNGSAPVRKELPPSSACETNSSLGRALYSSLMCGQIATQTDNAVLRTLLRWLKQNKPNGLEEFARHLHGYINRMQRLTNAGAAATV